MQVIKTILLALCIYAPVNNSRMEPAHAFGITDTLATGVVFQGVMAELNATINSAFSQGNFVVWHAGVQARLSLERWGEVNRELLDDAFGKLDSQQRQFFRGLNDAVARLDATVDKVSAEAQNLLDQTSQLVADVKFWGQPAVLRYSPGILLLEKSLPKQIVVKGISLDAAAPMFEILLPGKSVKLDRVSLTKQEARFAIPENVLTSEALKATQVRGRITLTHKKSIWFGLLGSEVRNIATEASLVILPKHLGSLTGMETFKKTRTRLLTDWKSREFHFSSGSVSEQCDIQTQNPSLDHKIDVDTVQVWNGRPNPRAGQVIKIFGTTIKQPPTLPGEWGRSGNQRLESNTTEGFAVKVCATRWADGFPPNTGPGYKHVIYRWREFKEAEQTKTTPHPDRHLSWLKDEAVKTTPGIDGIFATVKLFSGEERHEIREKLNGKYYTIEFEPKTGIILFKPQIPAQLNAIIN